MDNERTFSWFGPTKYSAATPRKRERKVFTPFDWSSEKGTRFLLQKSNQQDDTFMLLFTGVPVPVSKPGKLLVVASTQQAANLVEHVSANMRNFSTTLVTSKEITAGELRGPVSWSETLSIRGTSFGLDYTHVCSTQQRSYDSPENRVVVSALHRVSTSVPSRWQKDEFAEKDPSIRTALLAAALLNTKPLNGVKVLPASKLTAAKKRARNSRRPSFYLPALEVLSLPLYQSGVSVTGPDDILVLCDEKTRALHNLVFEMDKKLTELGVSENSSLTAAENALTYGELRFAAGPDGYVSLGGTKISVAGHENPDDEIVISHPEEISSAIVSTLRKRTLS